MWGNTNFWKKDSKENFLVLISYLMVPRELKWQLNEERERKKTTLWEIKLGKLSRLVHANRKEDCCNLKRITNWKIIANRPRKEPKMDWLECERGL